MELSQIQIEESLTSRGRAPESFVKPERDLSTPRGRLLAVRDIFVAIPAERIDMRKYMDGTSCGCALHHAKYGGMNDEISDNDWAEYFGLADDEIQYLFVNDPHEPGYPNPIGEPARGEFLRRLDEVLAGQ